MEGQRAIELYEGNQSTGEAEEQDAGSLPAEDVSQDLESDPTRIRRSVDASSGAEALNTGQAQSRDTNAIERMQDRVRPAPDEVQAATGQDSVLVTGPVVQPLRLDEALFGPSRGDAQTTAGPSSTPPRRAPVTRRQPETSAGSSEPSPDQGQPQAVSAEPTPADQAEPDIEQLAEKVYQRLRDRLRVERERHGGHRFR